MSYYHPSSYLEPAPYAPMSGYGYDGYNSGYPIPGYGYDEAYPYDDGYYGGSSYYRPRRHSYHVSILVTMPMHVLSGLKKCDDNRADTTTAATIHMVHGYITNIEPLEIG